MCQEDGEGGLAKFLSPLVCLDRPQCTSFFDLLVNTIPILKQNKSNHFKKHYIV